MKSIIVSQGPTHCYAGVGNVLITYYVGTPTAEPLREREPWIVSTLEHYQGVGLLVIIDARADGILPDNEFRTVSKEQAAKYGDRIHGSASAIKGSGVKYLLLRTFLRSLAVVIHGEFPVRFFNTAEEAATFAAEMCAEPASPSAEQLLSVVDELRTRLIEA